MFIGYDWGVPLRTPPDAGFKGEITFPKTLPSYNYAIAGDSGAEKKVVKSKEGSNPVELKRKASMESFFSSSVSSTTYTSFPPHPQDSSLWPRVTQVLQMSRKEEAGW